MGDYLKLKPLIEWWNSLAGRLIRHGPNSLRPDQQEVLAHLVTLLVSGTARAAFQQASGVELDQEGWAALVVSLAASVARDRKPFPLPPLSSEDVQALDQPLLQIHVPDLIIFSPGTDRRQ